MEPADENKEHDPSISASGEAKPGDLEARFTSIMSDLDLPSAEQITAVPAVKAIKIAVVITPLARAKDLAALCALSGLECTVVPCNTGVFAVKEFASTHEEWDISELLEGVDSEPEEASKLASELSRFVHTGVVLMTADLATDVGAEAGLSGTVTARRYVNGEAGQDESAGLLVSVLDQVVEDVLLGVTKASQVKNSIQTSTVQKSRALRWLGRGTKK